MRSITQRHVMQPRISDSPWWVVMVMLSRDVSLVGYCALNLTPVPLDVVGYWPPKNTIIVAREGTDPTQLLVPNVNFLQPF